MTSDPAPRRLHPATLISRWLRIIPQMAAGGIGVAAGIAREGFGGILLFAFIAMLAGLAIALLVWWRFSYTVGAGEIVIEKGVLHRQRRVIPFDRVQDISIEQPLLARLFGTARVKIETGGAGADEGSLDMIGLADARLLRDHIKRGQAAPVAEETEAAEPVLFEMRLGRLLLSGLFNFSLVFLAAIVAGLQYLDQFDLVDWEQVIAAEQKGAAAGLVTIRTTLILIGLVLLLGVAAGVIRTVARDFGFRLTRTEAGLRRRRGLLTLSEIVIPLRRTQVALIESGPVGRLLGWHALSFQTLGADRKEGGVQVAAPFARIEALLPILAEAGFPPPPPRAEFRGLPRRGLLRRVLAWLVLALAAGIAASIVLPEAGFGVAALLVLALLAVLRWRKHTYLVGERALFVSRGLLKRRLWIIPFEKTQTISTSRGPVQRRLRLASLLVDTAGASAIRAPEIVDLDGGDADALAERLLASFHDARAVIRLQSGLISSPTR